MAKKRTKRTPARRAARPAPQARTRPDWAPDFLAALAIAANVSEACRAAKIGRTAFYERRKLDPAFAAQVREAMATAIDGLEREIWRRAVEGWDEPVIHQGQLCGTWVNRKGEQVREGTRGAVLIPLTVKKYSNTLAVFLAKAHRPKKYRERHEHDHKHRGKFQLEIVEEIVDGRDPEETGPNQAAPQAGPVPPV